MLEDNYQETIDQHRDQLQKQEQAKVNEPEIRDFTGPQRRKKEPQSSSMAEGHRAVNQSPGPVILTFMVFVEIFLHVVLPFIVFLETLTTQFKYECHDHDPQIKVKLGSCAPSENKNPHKSGLVNTDTSESQCLVANKVTGILGGDVPPRRLKKKQRQKLSHLQDNTSQPMATQKSTVMVCRSLGGWDPKSLKKAFKSRARRVTLSSV